MTQLKIHLQHFPPTTIDIPNLVYVPLIFFLHGQQNMKPVYASYTEETCSEQGKKITASFHIFQRKNVNYI